MPRRKLKNPRLGLTHVGQTAGLGRVTPQLQQLLSLRKQWAIIVGATLSKKICPLKISGTVLTVLTPHNGWAYQLTMMQNEILAKVQKQTGIALTQVKWQVGILPEENTGPAKPRGQKCATHHRETPASDESIMDIVTRVRKLHQGLIEQSSN